MAIATLEREVPQEQKFGRSNRIEILDLLRGISIIYVVFYHLIYDLTYYSGMNLQLIGNDIFELIHKVFLFILFSVSGICTSFSRDIVKRGAVLFFLGTLLTFFTDIVMTDSVIVFGVLSFFGIMMMLSGIARPLIQKISIPVSVALAVVSLLLYLIFCDFASHSVIHLLITDINLDLPKDRLYLYPLGVMFSGFHSGDYFPLIPYGFMYLTGLFLSRPTAERKLPQWFYRPIKAKLLNFLGRHSLIIYIVHQPILLFLTLVVI